MEGGRRPHQAESVAYNPGSTSCYRLVSPWAQSRDPRPLSRSGWTVSCGQGGLSAGGCGTCVGSGLHVALTRKPLLPGPAHLRPLPRASHAWDRCPGQYGTWGVAGNWDCHPPLATARDQEPGISPAARPSCRVPAPPLAPWPLSGRWDRASGKAGWPGSLGCGLGPSPAQPHKVCDSDLATLPSPWCAQDSVVQSGQSHRGPGCDLSPRAPGHMGPSQALVPGVP